MMDCLDGLIMLIGIPLLTWIGMLPFKWAIKKDEQST